MSVINANYIKFIGNNMKCPKCNVINQNGSKYCRNCGSELPKSIKVNEKMPNNPIGRFCYTIAIISFLFAMFNAIIAPGFASYYGTEHNGMYEAEISHPWGSGFAMGLGASEIESMAYQQADKSYNDELFRLQLFGYIGTALFVVLGIISSKKK